MLQKKHFIRLFATEILDVGNVLNFNQYLILFTAAVL